MKFKSANRNVKNVELKIANDPKYDKMWNKRL